METVGWATTAVMAISGGVWILGHTLDQIHALSRKFVKAARSVHQARNEIRQLRHDRESRDKPRQLPED